MDNAQLYIGVDGGGTKTAYMLVDGSGAIVATHIAQGCNPSSVGEEKATALVHEGIRTLLEQQKVVPERIGRLLLCMAGSRLFWREMLAKHPPLPGIPARAVGDHQPVLELGTGGTPGMVLHAGTGSFIVARDPKGEVRVGGAIGYILGDPGSGFELGRLAVQRAVLQLQGLGKRGAICELACGRLQFGDLEEMARRVYHNPAFVSEAASLAPDILKLAEQGDKDALEIIEEAVTPFLQWASLMVQSTGLFSEPRHKAAISGAILRNPVVQGIARPIWQNLGHEWNFTEITRPPAEGVAAMVARGF